VKSIRATLLIWLCAGIAVAATVGAVVIYRNTLREADQFFDYHLRQAALILRDQAFEAASTQILAATNEYDFVVQVWTANGVIAYQSQPHASLPDATALGFASVRTDAGEWRTYGVVSRGYVIQVAQPMRARRDQAAELASRTLLPFLILVPVLVVIVLLVVPQTLGPLRRLARDLSLRPATNLQPIATDGLPSELSPLVNAFNGLLNRLAATLDREQAFIADAAHELRTPLTALRLQVDGLSAATDAVERTEAARQLSGGVTRAARLVEQLLSLARVKQQREELQAAVRLDDLLREVIAAKIVLADARHIDLGVTTADPFTLHGDAAALRALLGNLIDNAIRYSPEGGHVDASIVVEHDAGILRVIDNGPGIPAEEREKVFARFYRTISNTTQGSGLGLAIVRSVAEQHGTTVELGDAPGGHGLQVTVRFPKAS